MALNNRGAVRWRSVSIYPIETVAYSAKYSALVAYKILELGFLLGTVS